MAEDVKIYVSETVERIDVKVSDPFPVSVIPTGTLEINDIKANTLSSVEAGGSIPAEIYSWFKDKFALLVDKLLSSWVHGLIFITKAIDEALTSLQSTVSEHATSLEVIDTQIETIQQNVTLLDGRIEELENYDNIILYYVVPVDTTAIDLTVDKNGNPLNFQNGESFEIIIQVELYSLANRINLRFNNNSDSIYKIGSSELAFFYTAGSSYLSQHTSLDINLINGEVQGYLNNQSKMSTGGYTNNNYSFHTEGLNAENITSINLYKALAQSLIPSGSVILIRRR